MILIFTTALMYATPLIFAALGGVLSERSGIINIGLEGLMTFGAFIGSMVAYKTENPWLGFFAGGIAGLVLVFPHAVSSIWLKANQVVSSMALNFIGPGLSLFLCRLFFDGSSTTPVLDLNQKLPIVIESVYITSAIAVLFVIIGHLFFYYSFWGLSLRAIGEHPKAVLSFGVPVKAYRLFAVCMSGFLAGLGGASMSLAIVSNFRATLISGQGFIALAAMIFGRWTPGGALVACLFFGLGQSISVALAATGISISSDLVSLLPYVIALLALQFMAKNSIAPKALGQIID
jgi:simple sugar transport system permease protein